MTSSKTAPGTLTIRFHKAPKPDAWNLLFLALPSEPKADNMNILKYCRDVLSTAIYPDIGNNIEYPLLGLAGETGEVCEQIKKMIRDDGGKLTPVRAESIKKELGDVLWYTIASLCELRLPPWLTLPALESFQQLQEDIDNAEGQTNDIDAARTARGMSVIVGALNCAVEMGKLDNNMAGQVSLDMFTAIDLLAQFCGCRISDVARMNVEKLAARKAQGKLGGSGSDR